MNAVLLKSDDLVMIDGKPTVSSETIAECCQIEHRAVLQMLDKHKERIERAFGLLSFQMRDKQQRTGFGVRSVNYRVAFLTEPQASTLITFLQNTDVVLDFKVALNEAFFALRENQTHNAYTGLFLQEVPDAWRKTFPDSFFQAVCDCYGLPFVQGRTPGFFGGFINRYIYEPLLSQLPDELKAKRRAFCEDKGQSEDSHKLHQFLQEHCKQGLERHISTVETLLAISSSEVDFKEHFATRFEGRQQLVLEFQTRAERKKALRARKLAAGGAG